MNTTSAESADHVGDIAGTITPNGDLSRAFSAGLNGVFDSWGAAPGYQ